MIRKGDVVLYRGEKYEVFYVYENQEYCELKNIQNGKLHLVKQKEVIRTDSSIEKEHT